VNAYYAVYLYALAMQDIELQRFANTLLTMEVVSAQFYWHMSSTASTAYNVYDGVFAASGMVGNVGALDVTASTWFGDNAEFVHGINMYVFVIFGRLEVLVSRRNLTWFDLLMCL
jgi:endoglucanase Acf2